MFSVHFLLFFSQILLAITFAAEMEKDNPPIYTAVASKVIYPNSIYNISVFVEPNGAEKKEPVEVTAKISSLKDSFSSEEASVLPGQTLVIPIKLTDLNDKNYNLSLSITPAKGKSQERITGIFSSRRDKSILIQSDKAIYKPGETVKFRVVLLDRNLKPLSEDEPVDVKIFDGQRNLIKSLEDVSVQHGFYKNQLQLSSEPILGDWNIEVKLKNKTEVLEAQSQRGGASSRKPFRRTQEDPTQKTLSFSVEQYVLPKYEVTVKLPNYITFEDFKVPVQVGAKYTYGKAVVGSCMLSAKRFYSYDSADARIEKSFPINGTSMTEVNIESVFKAKGGSNYRYEQDIVFEASCTEEITGKVLNASSKVRIYYHPYNIERVKHTESLKPGLPYTAIFKISTPDNVPISDAAADALKISHGFSYDLEGSSFTSSIPENGLVRLTFRTPTNLLNQPKSIELTYKKLTKTFYNPSFYNSDAKTYMQIQLVTNSSITEVDDPTQVVQSKMTFNINATKPFQTINYLIHGRQDILASDQVNLPSPVTEYNLVVACPENADPEARIVIYTVLSETKDLLVDSLKFTAKNLHQDNYLNISLSEKTREPGQNLTLTLKASKGSLIALRGVDQSVLLLKEDKDISQKSLDEEVIARENEAIWSNRNWGGSDAFRMFEDGGLVILTNAKLKTPGSSSYESPAAISSQEISSDRVQEAPGAGLAPFSTTAAFGGSGGGGGSESIRVRTNFPESWLWEDVSLNDSSTFDLTKIVPDTLTSWVISGYSLNTETGVGIAEAVKLTTFRPFFLSLNLPYSVVKGEVLLLQVLVHNYLPGDKEVSAEITLDNSDGKFSFADEKIKNDTKQTKTITLKSNGVSSVKFAIVPQKFGLSMLNVKGTIATAGDALSQPLRVIPPGQRQKRSTAVLLNPSKSEGKAASELTASFPEKRVEGADKVQLTLISDILGPSISNLDQLLELPTGCGEQNMLAFVSDIVILNYLNATDSLSNDIRSKAVGYLESGYQRELTYRHYDGSFSSFGNNDVSGSTWLTAFVARSLIQAKPYITVDDNVIQRALTYLERQQTSDGGFYENGPALQWSLRGTKTTGGVALTAYTVLAFIEAQKNWSIEKVEVNADGEETVERSSVNRTIIDRALTFITEKATKGDFDDVYALVLATYAATLADHPSKDMLFSKLESSAKIDKGFTYWEVPKVNKTKTDNGTEILRIFPWEYYVQPVSVEMTSYSLLTYILRGKAADALPLVRWLLNQRNAYGGFISTQDTVLGLTALAQYAELTKAKETDLEVKFKEGSAEKSVSVTDKNAQVVQEFELPETTRSLDVAATGKGSVLAQLTWTYYVEDPVRDPAFAVNVKVSKPTAEELALDICTKYLGTEGSSNMAIVEVNLPSGYAFDTESLVQLKSAKDYKRYDLENQNTKLDAYFTSMSSEETCFPLLASRVFKVGKQSPAYVSVYDYYDTTKTARAFYEPPQTSICDICLESNDCLENNCV